MEFKLEYVYHWPEEYWNTRLKLKLKQEAMEKFPSSGEKVSKEIEKQRQGYIEERYSYFEKMNEATKKEALVGKDVSFKWQTGKDGEYTEHSGVVAYDSDTSSVRVRGKGPEVEGKIFSLMRWQLL